jgi:1-aminocyclopropane-1-carboxylate deaminase/D-cysteine desulfhydrase-like pyridoxal-dependent ACC family enzyme/RimJ/RimL family protein N-acetyltransferase
MTSEETLSALKELISKYPRIKLTDLPTPLQECPRFSRMLGGPRMLVKRDDLTGLALGGHKCRKFEFVLGKAEEEGADAIIYTGPSQSNEARLLAAAGAKVGMKVFLVPWRDAKSKRIQGNLLLGYILGADIRFSRSFYEGAVRKLAEDLRREGYSPYIIGPRDRVLGTIAFVELALELYEQLDEMGVNSSQVFLASDGGTQAGLILGFKMLQTDCQVIGLNQVRAVDREAVAVRIAGLANDAAKLLGSDATVLPREVRNYDDYVGRGYGVATKESLQAIELLARTEGILLDPVYTGKAMAGLIDHIDKGKIGADQTVVFLHTGGIPALFAYDKESIHLLGYKPRVASRLNTYATRTREIIEEKGIRAFLRQLTSYFLNRLFQYRRRWILEKDLSDIAESGRFLPRVENWDFEVIRSAKEIDDLLRRGFSIDAPFSMSDLRERLSQEQIGFCVFVEGRLAHWDWAVVNPGVRIYPPLKNINYREEAYLWQSITAPQSRGMGLATYSHSKRYEYLKEMGKSRVISTILKDNKPAIRIATKLGAKVCGEIDYVMILGREYWREKRYGNKQRTQN